MKTLLSFTFLTLFTLIAVSSFAQNKEEEELKAYYFVLLKKGPTRNQDSLTAARIQKEHLDNINRLAAIGKLNVAGPFLDDGEFRGVFIFDSGNEQEVRSLVESDPAVKAGRLAYEIHPWMTQKGICFK
jgi:uncharacterized protein YciI